MKRFEADNLVVALSHVAEGGQALVLWFAVPAAAFPGKVAGRGYRYARLYDDDEYRLLRTVRELGIAQAVISRGGGGRKAAVMTKTGEIEMEVWKYSWVKVWGRPLARAVKACREEVGGGRTN